jgi:hypothetical protein
VTSITLIRLLLLAGSAYLGFYVFALVMGVFSPGEVMGFTALAAVIVVAGAVNALRGRASTDESRDAGPQDAELARDLRNQRERRGY